MRWLLLLLLAIPCVAPDTSFGDSSSVDLDAADRIRQLREQSILLSGQDARRMLAAEWEKYARGTLDRRQSKLRRLRALGKQLADDQIAGNSRECSEQIFLETKWRILYTADFPVIDRRLRDLESSLKQKDQAYAAEQSAVDGSWGACFHEIFMKVEQTMLALEPLSAASIAPQYKVNLAPEVRTGNDFIAYLTNLVISDIASDGINHRSELASLTANGAAFEFKKYWQAYLENEVSGLLRHRDPGGSSKVRARITQFVESWQDPVTGYWGAWYRIGGRIYRTTDLSITFHLISYLQGSIKYWPQVIETTFRIENDPYPYGWRYGGGWNNHNNYDVVKIFRLAWPHMTEGQRKRAAVKMREMLAWALTQSLQPDGSFASDENFFSSTDSDFYFGVSFFDEVGYWRAKKRFWTDETFPGSAASCTLIRRRLSDLQLKSPLALATVEKLGASCGTPENPG